MDTSNTTKKETLLTTKEQEEAKADSATKVAAKTIASAPSIRSLAERSDSFRNAKAEKSNSRWLAIYGGLALFTGVAMAGGAIPFFIGTTIPALSFLSNKIILLSLTAVQIIVWSAIYGQNNSGFMSESYWRKITNSQPKPAETKGIYNKFKQFIKNWFPSNALSQRIWQDEETSLNHEIAKFDELAKAIVDGKKQDIEAQKLVLREQIDQYISEKYSTFADENDKNAKVRAALEKLIAVYSDFDTYAKKFTALKHLSPEDKARLAFKIANEGKNYKKGPGFSYLPYESGDVEVSNGKKFERKSLEDAGVNETIEDAGMHGTSIEGEALKEFQDAFTGRRDLVSSMLTSMQNNEEHKVEFGSTESSRMLFLTKKYSWLLKAVDVLADFIGVLNAMTVNAACVGFSSIQLMAFFTKVAAGTGMISAPMIAAPIAVGILFMGLFAGWNAAHTVTRMKTRGTFRDILLGILHWCHSPNKFERTPSRWHNFFATLIAVVISVGFCCFNAIAGAVIGDILYKLIMYRDVVSLTNAAFILNPTMDPTTWLGKLFFNLGLWLTIPSTGPFLLDAEHAWVSTFTQTLSEMYDYCRIQITQKISRNYLLGFAASVVVMPVTFLVLNALGVIPAIAAFKIALLSLICPSLYLLVFRVGSAPATRNWSEVTKIMITIIAVSLVVLMTVAVAAQVSISTSLSTLWLYYLSTQAKVNIWAAVTGVFGLIGFGSMFKGGLQGKIAQVLTPPSSLPASDFSNAKDEKADDNTPKPKTDVVINMLHLNAAPTP